MVSDPWMRASDADRDRVAEALREHHAAGRLTMEEFEERLDRVYAAKTLGELDGLMKDLPAIDLYQLPIPATQRAAPPSSVPQTGRLSPIWRAAWASWASVTVVCIVIWLLSSPGGYFWPAWVALPWGAAMGMRWLLGAAPGSGHSGRTQLHTQRRQMRGELRTRRRELRDEWRGRRPRPPDHRPGRGGGLPGLPWDPPGARGGDPDDR